MQSLAHIDHRGLQMHRLTQAILRDRLTPARAAAARRCTEAILAAGDPGDPPNPDTWTRWAQLTPHDHPDTLYSAHNLAADLRDLGEAADGP